MASDPNAPPTAKDVLHEVARAMVSEINTWRGPATSWETEVRMRHSQAVLDRLRTLLDDVPMLEYDEDGLAVIAEEETT